ncbi:MAG: maleylpyruvate isomerase family mycothiol-dependent enzyme [Frankia sp.]|nr:maleylpyruvate isomerase family mycothiol-dependent enzyme [Frankia sp.]
MDYLALLNEEADALLEAATSDLSAPVAGCPGWDCRRLVRHVARVLASTAAHLPRGVTDLPGRPAPAPEDDAGLLAYYRQAVEDALAALRATGPAAPAWNFTGAPKVAGFWPRRLAQELQIHAWDAAEAVGRPRPLDPALAADGIDELLRILLPAARASGQSKPGDGSAHVHLTDAAGEWTVRLAGPSVEVSAEHTKGDAALRGPAGPALLALWGRVDFTAGGLTPFGDQELLVALRPSL